MDRVPQHLVANFSLNTSNNVSKVGDTGVVHSAVAALRSECPGLSSSYFSNSEGWKRKWSPNYGSSLVLGLGLSSSYCTTMSSGKENVEQSSIDLGLSIDLHLGNERTDKEKDIRCVTPKALELEKPKLDIDLNLLTGPADASTVTHVLPTFTNNAEAPVIAGTKQVVDEGSTSSRWKQMPLAPPLHTLQSTKSAPPFHHVHSHIDPNRVTLNLSSPTVIKQKSSVAHASELNRLQQQHNTRVKTCQFNGCTRGARGSSGLCIAHGGGSRCQRAGCQKGAEGKTVFCKSHGGGRRCQHLGCTKSDEGRTDYCIGHGGGRRCSLEGCSRAARGKSGLCIQHGGGKRCKMENCSKSAEGISGLCISHGGGRRCQYPTCTKGAQGSTVFCKAHGGGKRCTVLGCTKGAEGSTPFCKGHGGGKRCSFEGGCTKSVHGGTSFCVNHGGGKRCAEPECTKSARGRTNFCVRHGGGKRCKSEGCGKSAQGSTDFCKAHDGGKRCSWDQLGSEFGGHAAIPCDKFARGKSGLCGAHSTRVRDKQIHGETLVHPCSNPRSISFENTKANNHANGIKTAGNVSTSIDSMGYRHQLVCMEVTSQDNYSVGNPCLIPFVLPEGRVHGGYLMAMLRGGTNLRASSCPGEGSPCWN